MVSSLEHTSVVLLIILFGIGIVFSPLLLSRFARRREEDAIEKRWTTQIAYMKELEDEDDKIDSAIAFLESEHERYEKRYKK